MKLIRKYGLYCGAVLVLIAFILLMATPAVVQSFDHLADAKLDGIKAIFGSEDLSPLGTSLTAWILLLVAILGLVFVIAAPAIKAIKLDKKALGLIAIGLGVLVLVAGILALCPTSHYANVVALGHGFGLGAGWAISGFLLILAALGICCDPILTLLGK